MKTARCRAHSQPLPLLPDEVMMEILSWVPVKPLLRFRCVCKSFKSLISDPNFVKLHLQRSPRNPTFVITLSICYHRYIMSCSKSSFLQNPYIAAQGVEVHYDSVVGSCNGLVCLSRHWFGQQYWVRFWNPELRLISKDSPCLSRSLLDYHTYSVRFGFGYDKSGDTYKVVALLGDKNLNENSNTTQVKVYTMGERCWRDIQTFSTFPILYGNKGCYLSGTLNWLAMRSFDTSCQELVIVSLDLGDETYKQFLLPPGLDKINNDTSLEIGILKDCLCLFHGYKKTRLQVWQMKEFGVDNSWIQLVNVSYQHLQIGGPDQFFSLPLTSILENENVLMFLNSKFGIILYNQRDDMVEAQYPNNELWIDAKDNVQSLIMPY